MKKECPKCGGNMVRRQRINKKSTGFTKTFFLCPCGWAQEEGAKEGYWST